MLWFVATASGLFAQESEVHYLHQGVMPPGAIGSWQLQRGGPLPGFFQPVEIKAPSGALVSLAFSGHFDEAEAGQRRVGMLIGEVYRLRVANIPLHAGLEVFPTIEVIDRLYPPVGEEHRFAIPIELTQEDLELAMDGKFVTRVIYLEDPSRALPAREDPSEQTWFDVSPGRDPLALADQMGRPVAILRVGGRLPQAAEQPDMRFLYGCPPFVRFGSDAVGVANAAAGPSAPVANAAEQADNGTEAVSRVSYDGELPQADASPEVIELLPPPARPSEATQP